MGSGRCGSTILGVTLGNCDGIFFVGELDRWLPSDGTPVLGGLERTRFWNRVRADVDADERLLSGKTRDTFERALGLVSPRLLNWRRRMRRSYRATTERLYEAIAAQAGATHIAESSHFPLRARELKAIDGIEVYLIFLVRHPQSVMASFTKTVNRNDRAMMRRRILTTNADLWATHLLAVWTFLRHRGDRRLFMRYEDFTADPQGVLRQVLAMSDSPAEVPDLAELHTGFPMGGNRLLRSEVVALKPETPKPQATEPITAALQMPLEALFSTLRPVAEASSTRTPAAAP
jgi:hypothetical protein